MQEKWVDLTMRFPSDGSILLPTRFGNAILAFEQYSNEVYDADGVTLWYHLGAVMPKEFQAAIGDARAQVDALVNLLFFSLVIAFAAIALVAWKVCYLLLSSSGLWSAVLNFRNFELSLVAFGGLLIAYSSYVLAIRKVYSWGNWIRAAFDCYLPDLAKKLGLKLPPSEAEQRKLWRAVTARASLNYRFDPAPWAQVDTTPATTSESPQRENPDSADKSRREEDEE